MGIDFRNGNYRRYVRFGKRTIKEGEAAVIWSRKGVQREVIGPSLQRLWYSQIRFMHRITAKPAQYVEVHLKSGAVEHIRGPITIFENPVHHDRIIVKDMVHVASALDQIIVYKEEVRSSKKAAEAEVADTNVDGNVRRSIIAGPTRYMQDVGEWVHEFKWSFNPTEPTSFTLLTTGTQQWDVSANFHTSDNAVATVTLTVEFQVARIDQVLRVEDPIASMRSGLEADLTVLGPTRRSDELQVQNTDSPMDGFSNYPHMIKTAQDSGLEISRIIFRGFVPSERLAKQNAARQKETLAQGALLLAADREHKMNTQALEARRLKATIEQEIADAEFANNQRKAEHDRRLVAEQQMHRLQLQVAEAENDREIARGKRDDVVLFMKSLHEMGVDLTQYLTSPIGKKGVPLPSTLDVRLAVAQALQLEHKAHADM